MRKVRKSRLFDYLMRVIVMRFGQRRLLIPFQTRYWTFNPNLIRSFHLLVMLVLREKFNLVRNNEKLIDPERLNGDKKN